MQDRAAYLLANYSLPRLERITEEDLQDFVSRASVCLPSSPLPTSETEYIANQDLGRHYNIAPYNTQHFTWTQPSTRIKGTLPRWVRIAIPEVLFESIDQYADLCSQSLTSCITSVLRDAQVDLKVPLSNVVVTGESSQIPGLQERIERSASVKILKNEFAENIAWTGASLASSLGLEGQKVSLAQFTATGRVPDWIDRLGI